MNKTTAETRAFFETLKPLLTPTVRSELLICPSLVSLAAAFEANASVGIALGAQNVYPKDSGAFTGEVSPLMLKEFVSLHESDDFINEKLHALLATGLKPILCVGETLSERKEGCAFEVIAHELAEGLNGVTNEQLAQVTVAYEPIWAIGTGETATPEIAEEMHAFMHDWLTQRFEASSVLQVRLLYGGSLKVDNAKQLLSQPHIDGGLIGGASLKPDSFVAIARIADGIEKEGV